MVLVRTCSDSFDEASNGYADVPVDKFLKASNLDGLRQASVLKETLDELEGDGLLEAYLRGSLSRGDADEHSDIDLFLVVEPEHIEDIYNKFCNHFSKDHKIIVSCYDRLVDDYGGIGFMFIGLDKDNKPLQFDLYMAMKGVPPQKKLVDCPRIFSRDPDYCWFQEHQSDRRLPEKAQAFIDRFTKGVSKEDKVALLLSDLAVTLSVMNKHVKRGQLGRSLNDNTHAINACVELLQEVLGMSTYQTPLYAVDAMIKDIYENHTGPLVDIAKRLETEMVMPPSMEKVDNFHRIGLDIVREFYPAVYEDLKDDVDVYRRDVLDLTPEQQVSYERPNLKMRHG